MMMLMRHGELGSALGGTLMGGGGITVKNTMVRSIDSVGHFSSSSIGRS